MQFCITQKYITQICIIENEYIPLLQKKERESAKKVLAHKSDFYMEIYDNQSNSGKQLLKALSTDGKNIFSVDYIQKHRLPASATIQRAVKDLINKGIVEKEKDTYFLTDPFFKQFIIHNS